VVARQHGGVRFSMMRRPLSRLIGGCSSSSMPMMARSVWSKQPQRRGQAGALQIYGGASVFADAATAQVFQSAVARIRAAIYTTHG